MPTYGIEPPDILPEEFPCVVIDGAGRPIPRCVRANTETGECDQIAFRNGVPAGFVVRSYRPLPIRFVRIDPPAPALAPSPPVRGLCVSSFTAGSLVGTCLSAVVYLTLMAVNR